MGARCTHEPNKFEITESIGDRPQSGCVSVETLFNYILCILHHVHVNFNPGPDYVLRIFTRPQAVLS